MGLFQENALRVARKRSMSPRWMAAAALAVVASLGVLCASCDSEATVNPLPGDGRSGRSPAKVIDFGEEFERIRIEAEP